MGEGFIYYYFNTQRDVRLAQVIPLWCFYIVRHTVPIKCQLPTHSAHSHTLRIAIGSGPPTDAGARKRTHRPQDPHTQRERDRPDRDEPNGYLTSLTVPPRYRYELNKPNPTSHFT